VGLVRIRSPVVALIVESVCQSMMEDIGSGGCVPDGKDMAWEICAVVTMMAKRLVSIDPPCAQLRMVWHCIVQCEGKRV
jgi:hypothetical protein